VIRVALSVWLWAKMNTQCTCMTSIQNSSKGRIYPPYSIMIWYVAPTLFMVVSPSSHFIQWDRKGHSSIVNDPYSVPGASRSSTSRSNTDSRCMNSIDNGLLLCVRHHLEFDAHLFSIHPEVGILYIFQGTCLNCHYARHML
jgi:hypothetical protein